MQTFIKNNAEFSSLQENFLYLHNKDRVFIPTPPSKQMNNRSKSQTPVGTKYYAGFLPIGSMKIRLVSIPIMLVESTKTDYWQNLKHVHSLQIHISHLKTSKIIMSHNLCDLLDELLKLESDIRIYQYREKDAIRICYKSLAPKNHNQKFIISPENIEGILQMIRVHHRKNFSQICSHHMKGKIISYNNLSE